MAAQDAETRQEPTPQLSKLYGPHLDVPITSARDLFRSALEKYHDKLAVASLYQPANYL